MGFGKRWSKFNRKKKGPKDEVFYGDKEWLLQYAREIEQKQHYDFYIFGHRHLVLDLPVGNKSRYLNLGEWTNTGHFAVYDGESLDLKPFPFP